MIHKYNILLICELDMYIYIYIYIYTYLVHKSIEYCTCVSFLGILVMLIIFSYYI